MHSRSTRYGLVRSSLLMVFRNSNHRGRKSWLPTIERSKTKSVLANRNQGQTSADCVPCLRTPPATHSRTWISG